MMNGAITLGTLDGANIEIADLAGHENEVIFGLTEPEVQKMVDEGSYNPWDYYNNDTRIKNVLDSLITGPWALKSDGRFRMIFDEIMNRGDQYFILADFEGYSKACDQVDALYANKAKWAHACIMNIAYSGYFSSDRTIAEYNRDIWHLTPLKVSRDE
jgi:starch phosphorylase